MRIELINPNNSFNAANIRFLQKGLFNSLKAKAYSPSLNLCMIAAYTPRDIEVSITDECVSAIDFNKKVDLVGITCLTATAPRAYEIADAFRERGVKVVMGGIHVSTLPDEALQHCDSVVIGEAEGLWEKVIQDFRRERLKSKYQNGSFVDLRGLPIPRRDLLDPKDYVTVNTVQTTRGCPFNCSFCSVKLFNGGRYRFRPVEDVVEEIKTLPSKNVFFVDDTILNQRERTKKLFKALIPLRIRWGSQSTILIAEDDELLELAARSGCLGFAIGLESFSRNTLDEMGKNFNRPEHFHRLIRKIKSYGMIVWGSFVLGFDRDDEGSIRHTIEMARTSKLDFACFNFLTPLPGTEVYQQLVREKRLNNRNWADYNMANLVFEPTRMSGETLEREMRNAWLDFYSLKAICKRLGFRWKKFHPFIWLINLALFYYTHKKIKRIKSDDRVKSLHSMTK
jgi:radical SAM superfamily enzyme YgiQ (UPF0313 family)